jgi:hypothetical protein
LRSSGVPLQEFIILQIRQHYGQMQPDDFNLAENGICPYKIVTVLTLNGYCEQKLNEHLKKMLEVVKLNYDGADANYKDQVVRERINDYKISSLKTLTPTQQNIIAEIIKKRVIGEKNG